MSTNLDSEFAILLGAGNLDHNQKAALAKIQQAIQDDALVDAVNDAARVSPPAPKAPGVPTSCIPAELAKNYFMVKKSWKTNFVAACAVITALVGLATVVIGWINHVEIGAMKSAQQKVVDKIGTIASDEAIKRIKDAEDYTSQDKPLGMLIELEKRTDFFAKDRIDKNSADEHFIRWGNPEQRLTFDQYGGLYVENTETKKATFLYPDQRAH